MSKKPFNFKRIIKAVLSGLLGLSMLTSPICGTISAYADESRYYVEYDANAPENAVTEPIRVPGVDSVIYNEDYTLPESPVLTGFVFKGWYLEKECIHRVGDENETLEKPNLTSIGQRITLYAGWESNLYTVKFDAVGGQVDPVAKSVKYGDTYGELPVPEREGYVFTGWFTSSGALIKNDTIVLTASDHTLTAQWSANIVKITYGKDAFYYRYENNAYYSDQEMTNRIYSVEVPAKVGSLFLGFSAPDQTMVIDSKGNIVGDLYSTVHEDMTLKENWRTVSYIIRYNGNVPIGTSSKLVLPTSQQSVTYGSVYTLASEPTLNGYKFSGWYADAGCTDYVGPASGKCQRNLSIFNDAIVNLYAKWVPVSYTVTYNSGSTFATGSMTPDTFTYDQTGYLSECGFEREGYLFDGWSLTNGGSLYMVNKDEVKNLTSEDGKNITLYARWKSNAYYVVFASDGDVKGVMGKMAIAYGEEVSLRPNKFYRPGYSFTGWKDPSGKTYADEAIVRNIAGTEKSITLTAIWKPNYYTIRFDKNGAGVTGEMADHTAIYDNAVELPSCDFTKPGYKFSGWSLRADGSGRLIENRAVVSNLTTDSNGIVTLYAKWTPITYTINFDGKGASGSMPPVNVKYDTEIKLPAMNFSAPGYTFLYWKYNDDIYEDGAAVKNIAFDDGTSVTFEAIWQANKYSVSFKPAAAGVSGTMEDQQFEYGKEEPLTANAFRRIGYSFKGWSVSDMSETIAFTDKQSVKNLVERRNGVLPLYAVWEPLHYNIAFDSNGGTGIMQAVEASYGTTLFLPKNSFTRDGYSFKAWNEKSDGTGQSFKNGEGVKNLLVTDGTYTLYAQWEEAKYNILFDANGGTGSMESARVSFAEEFKLPESVFKKIGYTFTSWNTKPDGSGTVIANMSTVRSLSSVPDSDVILYAQYRPNRYTVRFNPNGGTGTGLPDLIATYGEPFTIKGCDLATTGNELSGWNELVNGGGASYEIGRSYKNLTLKDDDIVTLYAQYKPVGYRISYNANGGEGTMDDVVLKFNENTVIKDNLFVHPGRRFDSWNTKPNGMGITYKPGDIVSGLASVKDETVTLYAIWRNNTYTIKYNANGGKGLMNEQQIEVGEELSLFANAFLRDNFIFSHWNTKPDDSGTSYSNGQQIKDLSKKDGDIINLYAIWQGRNYTVTYHLNGGSFTNGFTPATDRYAGEVFTLPQSKNVYKEGCLFTGWYANPSLIGKSILQIPETSGDIEVYASWYDISEKRAGISQVIINDYSATRIPTEINPDGMLITHAPDRLTYVAGDSVDMTGAKVELVYSDDSRRDITSEVIVNDGKPLDAGTESVTVKYDKYTASLTGLTVAKLPNDLTIIKSQTIKCEYSEEETKAVNFTGASAYNGAISYTTSDPVFSITQLRKISVPAGTAVGEYDITVSVVASGDNNHDGAREDINIHLCIEPAKGDLMVPPKNLNKSYNGKEQVIVSPGRGSGTMYYSLVSAEAGFSDELPKAIDAGEYTVWYYVRGDKNHSDTKVESMKAEILKAPNELSFENSVVWDAYYSVNAQTYTLPITIDGNGKLTYTLTSQYLGDKGTTVFNLAGKELTLKANAPKGTYTVHITISADGDANHYPGEDDLTVTVHVDSYMLNVLKDSGVDYVNVTVGGTFYPNVNGLLEMPVGAAVEATAVINEICEFVDWSGSYTSTNPTISFIAPKSNVEIKASTLKSSYSVSYDANGGENAPDVQYKIHDEALVLSKQKPTKEGCRFAGWGLAPDSMTAAYQPGASYKENKTIVLYALWSTYEIEFGEHTPIITFNANGGVGAPSPSIKEKGVPFMIPAEEPTKEGYIFSGWGVHTTDIAPTYLPGDLYIDEASITLYALWSSYQITFDDFSYTVEFDANGGVGAPDPIKKAGDASVKIPLTVPTRSGYIFAGWTDSPSGTILRYKPGDTYNINVNIKLYAMWSLTEPEGTVVPPTVRNLTYNGYAQTLINPGSSTTGTVKYKLGSDGAYSTSLPTAKAAGEYTVYYMVVGDGIHKDVPEASVTVTIKQKEASLSWGTTSWVYDGNSHSTTCSVGNLEGSDTCTATLTGNSITDVGSTTVTATGLSNSNYKLPSSTSKTITVTAASVGDKPTTAVSKTYNGSAQNNGYTKPAGVTMTGNNSGTNAGTYTATYTPDSNHTWSDGTRTAVTVTLTINKANGSVTAPTAKTLTYNGSNQTLINAGSSTTGTIQYKLGSSGTYGTSLPQAKDGGTYTIYYKVIGDDNHKDVAEASIKVNIKYLIEFDANGGTGAPSSTSKVPGTALTLSSTKPTLSGSQFVGWSTSSTGTTVDYAAGGSYTADANVKLYAVWFTPSISFAKSAS